MSTLKVESLRHYDADSDALTLSSSGTITFNGTLVGATDSAQVQAQIDSAAVTLTGDQTIAGTKTFSSTPKSSNGFEAATAFRFTKSTTSGTDNALYYDSDNLYVGRDVKDLRFRTNGGTVALGIDSAGSIYTGSTGLGDKLSLYDNRLNATNMYGLGIGGSTLYYKSLAFHDFYVADNYDGASHKVRIDAHGIKFHGDTAAANALDDYEEGTWTPTLEYGSCTTTGATYTKIGRMVYAEVQLTAFSDRSTAAAVKVGGLPYSSSSTSKTGNVSLSRYINRSGDAVVSYLGSSRNYMHFYSIVANADYQQVYHSHLSSSSSNFYISIIYETT
jgi:hypothetical protein